MIKITIGEALVIVLCIFLAQWWSGRSAHSHDWYGEDCCSHEDCRPAKVGEVVEEKGGFTITTLNRHLRYEDPRIRYGFEGHIDGRYHVCEERTWAEGVGWSWNPRCLYVPHRGT